MRHIDIMAGFEPADVEAVAAMLTGGGVGIIPTDTVYGLAAVAGDEAAVRRVLELKGRPADKPLPVQVATMREANILAEADGAEASALAERFWPGPLTMVLKRRPFAAELAFQDEKTIGLRIPDEMFCLSLIEHAGYLVVPSANPAGASAPATLGDVSGDLLDVVDFVVNAGACPCGVESTVVDLTAGVRVLREGAIPAEDIDRALSNPAEPGGTDV